MKKFLILQTVLCVALTVKCAVALDSLTLLATLVGENENDFMVQCASAGDVNNDGFDDIIVGATQLLMDRGYALIYFGGTEFDTIPDVRLIGEPFGPGGYSRFGVTVASAGDVNDDGYDDVLVGADFGWNGEVGWRTGKAFLFLGGEDMDSIPDVTFLGSFDDFEYFGGVISSAGDINDDGYDDVIIGCPSYRGGWLSGRAYIYFGGQNMDNEYDICIQGGEGDFFGNSVNSIGDVNQDGYEDVLIGAACDGHTGFEGRASIYFGGDPMDTTADVTFWGDSASFKQVGSYIASAGDVNGDTDPDVMIVGGYEHKRLKVFLGGPAMDTVPDVILGGSHAISPAGDLNKDGFGDIMVSGTIFFGGDPMDTLPDISLPTGGYRVAAAGDINKDGYEEVLLSTVGDTTWPGTVFVFTSEPTSVVQDEEEQVVKSFRLHQNYPNPFNSVTAIQFDVEGSEYRAPIQTTLRVYNIRGRLVRTLLTEKMAPGTYRVTWDGKDECGKEVASGIYLYRVRAGSLIDTKKMLVLK
ncbi:MAG: FlgD immunoglobulin-like domain containing protein [Candidatus Zixiibacteriota bacterium]